MNNIFQKKARCHWSLWIPISHESTLALRHQKLKNTIKCTDDKISISLPNFLFRLILNTAIIYSQSLHQIQLNAFDFKSTYFIMKIQRNLYRDQISRVPTLIWTNKEWITRKLRCMTQESSRLSGWAWRDRRTRLMRAVMMDLRRPICVFSRTRGERRENPWALRRYSVY